MRGARVQPVVSGDEVAGALRHAFLERHGELGPPWPMRNRQKGAGLMAHLDADIYRLHDIFE